MATRTLLAAEDTNEDRHRIFNHALGFITTFPPGGNDIVFAGTAALVSGTLYLVGGGLRAGDVITSIVAHVVTAGSSLSLVKVGLFSKVGTQLAVSASNHTNFTTSNSMVATALTSPYTVTTDDLYYAGILAVHSGAGPALPRSNASFDGVPYGANPRPNGRHTGLSDMPNPAIPGNGGPAPLLFAA